MSRRSAPRKRVIEVWHTGAFGGTSQWHHKLECGHTDSRKRKAPSSEIGCTSCEVGASLDSTTIAVSDAFASSSTSASIIRAKMCSALSIPADAINVQFRGDTLAGALIMLDPKQVLEIIER